MIEALVLGFLGIAALVLVPLLLVGLVLKVGIWLILLPFRLLGMLLGVLGGVLGAVVGVLSALGGLLLAIVGGVLGIAGLALLPILLVVGGAWLLFRWLRPARSVAVPSS
jgi:hypothetical protein